MGLPWSHHKNNGWKSQLERVRRWYKRIEKVGSAKSTNANLEDEHDDVYTFFQNCYYLREWLEKADVVAPNYINDLFKQNIELQICRDICNGTKHFDISRPSVDADFSFGREYVPKSYTNSRPQINETWFLFASGEKYDVFSLAAKCMGLWESFIQKHNLDN